MTANDLPYDVRAVGRQVREIPPPLRKAGIDIRVRATPPPPTAVEIRPRLAQ